MNKNKFFRKVIVGILGILLVAALATSAGAVPVPAGWTGGLYYSGPLTGTLSIMPFNHLLGELTGVTLYPYASVEGSIEVYPFDYDVNDDPIPPDPFNYGANTTIDFSGIGEVNTIATFDVPAPLVFTNYDGFGFIAKDGQSRTNDQYATPPIGISVANIDLFNDGKNGGINIEIPVTLFGFTNDPLYSSITYQGDARLQYEYTYTPFSVPEPATMLLLGLGLVGLAGVRKRMAK